MFKGVVIFFVIGCAFAIPEAKPEANADAKPGIFAPVVTSAVAPAVAHSALPAYSAYSALPAYSAYSPYLAPYAAAYSAYSPYAAYSAPLVVV